MNKEENWDLILIPKTKLFDLQLSKIWSYRDLLMLFVKRDIVSFYKQTIFGPFWFFIQPIFTTIVFTVIFGNIANLPTGGLPKPLFYLAGITSWNYFSDCLLKTSTTFKDNASIFGKVYFPRLITPLSIVVSSLVRFLIQFLLLILVILYYLANGLVIYTSWKLLLFPLFVLFMAMQGLGIGMMITAMTTKYKDLTILVPFVMQLMMYATSVVYPLSSIKGKNFYFLVTLNPMTYVIEGLKACTLGSGVLTIETFFYSFSCSLFLLVIGVLIFNKVEKDFIDTI